MSPSSAPSPLVVGLDIGTTKICAIVAGEDEHGALAVLGISSRPSSGVRRGIVVDVPDTIAAIKDTLSRAAHMAGVQIEGVVAGVTGDHVVSENRMGSVTVASQGREISSFDVERALAATLLEVGRDVEVIHCLPRSFSLDGQGGLRKPIGLVGSRLEVEAHVVTGQNALLRNTFSCVAGADVRADALVLEPVATAEAVSTRAEREMGVLILDIGGGTSDLAAFVDGSAVYSAALPVGGNHVTRDISIGLSTPFEFAESLKVASGAATREMIPHGEALEVMTAGGASRLRIPRALLGEIIEARMRELFELSLAMAVHSGLAGRVPGGLILSGGGALLPGAIELAGKIFGLPVRLGVPEGVAGWSEQVASPQFATAVGLCRIALAQQQPDVLRAAMLLPHTRRVWSQLPPGVVMARSVAPDAVADEVSSEAPETKTQAKSDPVVFEEFPAQMQFAPSRPAPSRPQESPAPAAPVQLPVEVEAQAPYEPEPESKPEPEPAFTAQEPVVEPQIAALPVVPSSLETRSTTESETRSTTADSVPLLAMKSEAQDEPAPESSALDLTPASRPAEAASPRETVSPKAIPSSSARSAASSEAPAPSQPKSFQSKRLVPSEIKTSGPLDAPRPKLMGLPAPRDEKTVRSRLQDLLAWASAALEDTPAPARPKEKETRTPQKPRAKASPTPASEGSGSGDSSALHWWLRFKTFIGFGEE